MALEDLEDNRPYFTSKNAFRVCEWEGGYRNRNIGFNLAIGKIGRLYAPVYNLKAGCIYLSNVTVWPYD